MNRRQLSASLATLLCAGCLSESPRDDRTATARCPGTVPVDVPVAVRQSNRFTLSISAQTVTRGEQVTVTLRNVSGERQQTGDRNKFDVQAKTADGWDSVLRRDEESVWDDEAVPHDPDSGFQWTVTVSDGLTFENRTFPRYETCGGLDPGRYRFVYWGLIGETDDGRERALGVQFRLTDE